MYLIHKDNIVHNFYLPLVNVGPKGDSRKGKKANYGTGKETLRFRANGEAQIEQVRTVILISSTSFKCTRFFTSRWLHVVKHRIGRAQSVCDWLLAGPQEFGSQQNQSLPSHLNHTWGSPKSSEPSLHVPVAALQRKFMTDNVLLEIQLWIWETIIRKLVNVEEWLWISIICKIWGFHGGEYEKWRLLGCYAVWLL
jgi:hypothetical protein